MRDVSDIIKHTYPLNLLYVEDNKDAREAVLTILEDFFENIIICVDGEDGLEKFKTNDIDLIISDINMPKLNGLEMIKEIRDIDSKGLDIEGTPSKKQIAEAKKHRNKFNFLLLFLLLVQDNFLRFLEPHI